MVVAKELEVCVLLEDRDFVVHRTVAEVENQAGPDLIALHDLDLVSDADNLPVGEISQPGIHACFPACGSRESAQQANNPRPN